MNSGTMTIGGLPGLRDLSPFWPERLDRLWSDRVAVVDPDTDTRYTYRDLAVRASAVAAGLARLGVGQGDRVVALLYSGVPVLDLLFACGRLGAILVPLNWRLSRHELSALVQDVEPAVVVADGEFAELARSSAPDVPLITLEGRGPGSFGRLLEMTGQPPRPDVRMDDPWLILYTGGTTGVPKGAVLTHGSITWNAINTAVSWGLSERDIGPSFTPMFHTGGLNVFTLPLLMLGGRVILPRRFDPAQALEILRRERPTVLFFVPTMFRVVAEQPHFEDLDLSGLRWAISGGAPLPEAIYDLWKDKVRIFKQGYGLTEVGPNNFATSDEEALRIRGTNVGRLTLFASARIVDGDGNDLPDGTPGELLLAGPHMCAGYWRRPDATAEAIRDGWFHTGDVAVRDEEGFYAIVDRKKDMIITGGENVYPAEVEAMLSSHPAVREVAVVGLPDPVWGEAVCAVVSLKPGAAAAPDELNAYMRGRIARYKSPKRYVIVEDVPKNAAGKIVRADARRLLLEGEAP